MGAPGDPERPKKEGVYIRPIFGNKGWGFVREGGSASAPGGVAEKAPRRLSEAPRVKSDEGSARALGETETLTDLWNAQRQKQKQKQKFLQTLDRPFPVAVSD